MPSATLATRPRLSLEEYHVDLVTLLSMTPEEANQIIDTALRKLGVLEVASDYFLDARFNSIPWLPMYSRKVATKVWAIELIRGDRIPDTAVKSMVNMMAIDQQVQPAFFVPEDEPYEYLFPMCRENGIALIAKVSDEYEILVFPSRSRSTPEEYVVRIPDWVIDHLSHLVNLEPALRSAILAFSRRYKALLASGRANEENQETLLRKTFIALLSSDQRFAGEYAPLNLLRFFEQSSPEYRGRDHYFHTFNNFLLGCIVIDQCYAIFEQFRKTCFPKTRNWSIEYAWLLTVLFHDVGYPIQRHSHTSEMIYGVPVLGEESAIAERKQAWESPPYRISRAQLVSLHDHLSQKKIKSDWSPDPFPVQKHPLDKAFERSFLKEGHGVASCMRMLADFFHVSPSSPSQRQFLARHVFLAGLSIPFHDWRVRRCLREEEIFQIRTGRFPFATLLMFIDSIQEDRRGKTQSPDILTGISVNGSTITAEMNLPLLSQDKLREKKREAKDVKDFLEEDLLRFEYPAGLL